MKRASRSRRSSAAAQLEPATAVRIGALERHTIVTGLVARGVRADRAGQYADAFLEYTEASNNIREQGAMVLHPRTANPIENPYLKIRDRALAKLRRLRGLPAEWLW